MNCIGGSKSCDFAMNCTLRRIEAPMRKWSMNDEWIRRTIRGRCRGKGSASMPRTRRWRGGPMREWSMNDEWLGALEEVAVGEFVDDRNHAGGNRTQE